MTDKEDVMGIIFRLETLQPIGEESAALIVRLARLGLWAEEYGVPAMKDASRFLPQVTTESKFLLDDALATLPKAD